MLLPREQSSWNCGYVLGAIALQCLRVSPADLPKLQTRMSERLGRPISPTQVTEAATWLYMLEKVRLDDEGTLHLCY